MAPVYRSEAVVLPAADEANSEGIGGLSAGLGGLAALAGVSLGGGRRNAEALALLKSRTVLELLIGDQNLLPVLYPNRWDSGRGKWKDGVKQPSLDEAVLLLREQIYQIREDLKSGLITVRFEWTDRYAAARWANRLVEIANEESRRRTIADASAALGVLNEQLRAAESIELKSALSRLMESQLRARTIAQVRREYAFVVIDKAVVPDANRRVRPARTLMVAFSALVGFLLSAAVVAWLARVQGRSGLAA